MTRPISKSDLTRDQRELLDACGPDAADHPLVLDGKILRFRGNAVIVYLFRAGKLDLNQICLAMGNNEDTQHNRHNMREFYRLLGYSLCGYLDIFGDQLAEKNNKR